MAEITHNFVHRWARGRYKVTHGGWVEWTLTLRGARRAARRLERQAALHGTKVAR